MDIQSFSITAVTAGEHTMIVLKQDDMDDKAITVNEGSELHRSLMDLADAIATTPEA
jgi:hypothetical protein